MRRNFRTCGLLRVATSTTKTSRHFSPTLYQHVTHKGSTYRHQTPLFSIKASFEPFLFTFGELFFNACLFLSFVFFFPIPLSLSLSLSLSLLFLFPFLFFLCSFLCPFLLFIIPFFFFFYVFLFIFFFFFTLFYHIFPSFFCIISVQRPCLFTCSRCNG
ncbi:unnamed protein product [Acanthosepion pharaonis]|uniref:Uncharacterized protein n=1 Tax=Acanthosepion pharaonis TaxID=158019 RepID=A0A812DJS7_ACAPH|nr:unnamed protein product [Sepia pharaonis]